MKKKKKATFIALSILLNDHKRNFNEIERAMNVAFFFFFIDDVQWMAKEGATTKHY
jgi:hypothetical protein